MADPGSNRSLSHQEWQLLFEEYRKFYGPITQQMDTSVFGMWNNLPLFSAPFSTFPYGPFQPPSAASTSSSLSNSGLSTNFNPTQNLSTGASRADIFSSQYNPGNMMPYTWTTPDTNFPDRSSSNLQKKERTAGTPMRCPNCKLEFPCYRSFKVHQNLQMGRQYKCPFMKCSFVCSDQFCFKDHFASCQIKQLSGQSENAKINNAPSTSWSHNDLTPTSNSVGRMVEVKKMLNLKENVQEEEEEEGKKGE